MGLLDGKVAVVTAAGSGMGKASAKIFAREGAKVVISDISGAQEQTAKEIGGSNVVVRHCDGSKEADVEALIGAAVSKFGRLDAMLNVTGHPGGCRIEDVEEAILDKTIAVSLKSHFFGAKHAIRAMKDKGGGAIINWSSVGGLRPSAFASVYCACKAATAHLARSIALEYGQYNIRGFAICPGMIATEGMGAQALQSMPQYATANPIGRAGTSEEAGELAAFLASDRAVYMNGAVIPLDGGWSLTMR
jgi:NAD(P)-dependent dehydrogenase (short-subunit alcohol dehydrogenase family)